MSPKINYAIEGLEALIGTLEQKQAFCEKHNYKSSPFSVVLKYDIPRHMLRELKGGMTAEEEQYLSDVISKGFDETHNSAKICLDCSEKMEGVVYSSGRIYCEYCNAVFYVWQVDPMYSSKEDYFGREH